MTLGRTYLDWNATAPLHPDARAAMIAAMDVTGNPSSVHADGRAARALVETAREQVAELVNVRAGEVIFTSGATEANRWVLGSDWHHVFTGAAEHVSVLAPARAHDARQVAEIACGLDGVHRIADIANDVAAACGGGRVLVSIGLVNGETGVVQPVRKVCEALSPMDAVVHTDAAQAAGRIAIDFAALGVHAMSLSAHKLGGPKGAGALILKDGVVLAPLMSGGGQERRRRAGTENVAAIAGFGAAAVAAKRALSETARVRALRDMLEAGLRARWPHCVILCADSERVANTTLVSVPGKNAGTAVIKLDLAGVSVSAGAACSSGKAGVSHVLTAMGLDPDLARGALRISLGPATVREDIERFLSVWGEAMGQSALAA